MVDMFLYNNITNNQRRIRRWGGGQEMNKKINNIVLKIIAITNKKRTAILDPLIEKHQ